MNHSTSQAMYYLAILGPPQVDKKILEFKHWMRDRFGCVVALKSPAHITLIPPFWFDEENETKLLRNTESFTSDLDEVKIQLDGFSHFGKKVLFVNVKENPALEELRDQTGSYFSDSLGDVIKIDDRPFHPHITIANRDLKPHDFEIAWEHFAHKDFRETFQTRTISLLKLIHGKWNMIGEKRW